MDEELMRAKWVLSAAFVFLISGCMTYTELEYLVFGHTTDARVVDAKLVDTSERRFRTTEKLRIDYQFTEPDGTARKGQQDLSPDRIEELGETVSVRYTPGKDGMSRMAGTANVLLLGIFFISLAAIIGFGAKLVRDGNEAARELARGKRRTG